MGAYSQIQYMESGFDGSVYEYNDEPGVFTGTLVCKRYGRRVNIIAYIGFDDGRKVVCSAYSSKNYLGLKDIEMGSRVEVSFAPNTNGKVQLTAIAVIE